MKFKKLTSILLSGIIAISALGSLTANAEDSAEDKKLYKLSELFAMSKEEFFALPLIDGMKENGIELLYKFNFQCFTDSRDQASVFVNACRVVANVEINDGTYKPYYTEKAILELLDTDYKGFKVSITASPIKNPRNVCANFEVARPASDDGSVIICNDFDGRNEEDCLNITKIQYCVNQILPEAGVPIYPMDSYSPFADPNGDESLNILDAAFIAKKIAGKKIDELTVEQADFNNDDTVDILDAASIAKFVALRYGAKYLFK